MATSFAELLKAEIFKQATNYHTDNHDFHALGKPPIKKKLVNIAKWFLFRRSIFKLLFRSDFIYQKLFLGNLFGVAQYLPRLDAFYSKLADQQSKDLLLTLIAHKLLGYVKVKLPYNKPGYWDELQEVVKLRNEEDIIDLPFSPWKLYFHDLNVKGLDIKMYFTSHACYSCVIREHYLHHISANDSIGAEKDDVVLDLGGCYGDTAMYFANKVGEGGKVYSFEFIKGNIHIFNRNLDLNPLLKPIIEVVDRPLWDESGKKIFYNERGGASKVSFEEFQGVDGGSETITIDDFVKKYNVDRVDFIKTDIEGAEPYALKGSVETLRRFKPKLAISIYHGMEDFLGIIEQIDKLDLGYKFYLGSASIFFSEIVLFCRVEE